MPCKRGGQWVLEKSAAHLRYMLFVYRWKAAHHGGRLGRDYERVAAEIRAELVSRRERTKTTIEERRSWSHTS